MKYKYFPTPFFTPAITKSKSLHGVLRVNFPHKNGPIPLWLVPDLITSKSNHPPGQSMLFQVLLIWQLRTLMIDKIQSFPLTLDSPAKPDHQGIHCPIANFGLLSTSSITNPILITVFDTYLTPRSPGPWVWTKTLSILNVAP